MSFEGDPLAFYGKNIIDDYHASLMAQLEPETYRPKTLDYLDISDEKLRFLPDKKVVILGAGVAGLYTALILDSLNVEFEILEASSHVGGRLSTYKFPNGGMYDYYDPGAMRYPLPEKDEQGKYKNGIMKRLADLIVYLDFENSLIPYYYKAREGEDMKPGFYYFNGVRKPISEDLKEDFRAKEIGVHADYIKAGAGTIAKDVIKPFVRVLADDLKHGTKRGWQMMKENDSYSVRAYMISKYLPSADLELPPRHLPNDVVNWCSLLGGSSGGYDRALTESVLSSLAFAKVGGTDFGKVEWKCFDGGSEVLPQKMAEKIGPSNGRIHFGRRVDAISHGHVLVITVPSGYPTGELPEGAAESDDGIRKIITVPGAGVAVRVTSEPGPRVYSHVISTLPLPVLRTIDIGDGVMSVRQKNALRQLQYGPSIKIAIHFREPWWTTRLGIVGGQSFTDLPLRTIVYPSYGVDSNTPSAVLIASYCWTTDADRLGSLATPEQKEVLKMLVLRNLAEAHGNPITYEFLQEQFRGMDVKDWNRDANAMGAFPYFGPGDFQNLYTSLTYPAANGRLHFAGDAISTRHAWVVGALDSAWRAVYEYLCVTKQDGKKRTFFEKWGGNAEWTPLGAEYDHEEPDLLRTHLGLLHRFSDAGQV